VLMAGVTAKLNRAKRYPGARVRIVVNIARTLDPLLIQESASVDTQVVSNPLGPLGFLTENTLRILIIAESGEARMSSSPETRSEWEAVAGGRELRNRKIKKGAVLLVPPPSGVHNQSHLWENAPLLGTRKV
jgi:hypothetical protein